MEAALASEQRHAANLRRPPHDQTTPQQRRLKKLQDVSRYAAAVESARAAASRVLDDPLVAAGRAALLWAQAPSSGACDDARRPRGEHVSSGGGRFAPAGRAGSDVEAGEAPEARGSAEGARRRRARGRGLVRGWIRGDAASAPRSDARPEATERARIVPRRARGGSRGLVRGWRARRSDRGGFGREARSDGTRSDGTRAGRPAEGSRRRRGR